MTVFVLFTMTVFVLFTMTVFVLFATFAGITFEGKVQLLAFCVFEACVGLFWPSMMKMRSQYLPEESRSTIINFFRIPLNMFVCIMLYNVSPSLHPPACPLPCCVFILLCLWALRSGLGTAATAKLSVYQPACLQSYHTAGQQCQCQFFGSFSMVFQINLHYAGSLLYFARVLLEYVIVCTHGF